MQQNHPNPDSLTSKYKGLHRISGAFCWKRDRNMLLLDSLFPTHTAYNYLPVLVRHGMLA